MSGWNETIQKMFADERAASAPAPQKAAPIPADVLALAEEAGRAIWDGTPITPSKVRKAIALSIIQDRANRAHLRGGARRARS